MGVSIGGRYDYRFGIEDILGCVLSIRNESTFMRSRLYRSTYLSFKLSRQRNNFYEILVLT